ncbi:unnamed protein product, partial [Rotaria sp. Silwood2]
MLDYFEDNYIVRFRANGSRTRPLFTIEYWNAHERTNNSAEAWNRCIILSQLTGGLTCYQCTNNCNDPFNPKNIQQITVADDQGYTCAV